MTGAISQPGVILTRWALASLGVLLMAGRSVDLEANVYPPPYDAKGRVLALEALLTTQGDRYSLVVLEPFEGIRQYRPHAPSTELAETRYVHQTPDDPGFAEERRMVEAFGENATNDQSLLVQCSFTSPGRQHFEIRPSEPLRITGQPYRLSLWIHSQSYRHRLEFVFRNADGQSVHVDAGNLNWKGWRRIDLTLPDRLYRAGRRVQHRFGAELESIVIHSHPGEQPGAVALLLDQLLILTDMQLLRYPGSGIVDSW